MSKVGIQSVKYSKIVEGKYTGATEIGTLVTFNGTPNRVEGEDWGDNRMVESNKSVNKIALSMELNDMAAKEYADICGHTYDETKKKVTVKTTDNAPYVGIGAVGNSERDGKNVYIMKFYPYMQFGEPGDDNATGKESIEYRHTTVEGTGYPNANNELKIEQEFNTLEAAEKELETLMQANTDAAVPGKSTTEGKES